MQGRRMARQLRLLCDLGDMQWHAIETICRRYGINTRTMTRDLQHLRSLGLRVERSAGSVRLTSTARARLRQIMLD